MKDFTDLFTPPPANLPVSQTDNPYWDMLRTVPGDGITWRYDRRWTPDSTALRIRDSRLSRNDLCQQYAWAIPDPAALAFCAHWLSPRAIEIGAGTGYWAWQLSQLGVDVVAYDLHPPQHTGDNWYHSPRTEDGTELASRVRDVFFNVQAGNELLATEYPDRTLFLCWPPYASDMATKCLNCYLGKRLVFIGEGDGGCTGDDTFFEALDAHWEVMASHQIVQWSGLHDEITVYERKRVAQ